MLTHRILPIASAVVFLFGTGLAGAEKIKAPTEPSNLTVKPLGVNSFELKWKDNSNNEVGWNIFAALKGTTPVLYQRLDSPNANTFVVVTNELPGKAVSFQIAAYSGTIAAPKASKKTSVVSATAWSGSTFGAPTNFRVEVVDDGQVRLLWKDNSTRETGYQMEYKLATAKAWVQLGTRSPGISFSVPASGFLPLTSYVFRVRAFNAFGNVPVKFTAYTPVVKAKIKAFQAPSNLVVTPEADGAFSFKWKDNSSIETGFEIQQKVGTADFALLGTIPANAVTTDPVLGFVLDTDHQFRIRSFRVLDGKNVYSDFSNVVLAKSSSLQKPATLAGTATSDTSLTLTWTGSSPRATGYAIEYREADTTEPFTTTSAAKVLTATISNLSPGKLYEVRLKAISRDFFGNITASSAYTPSVRVLTKDGILGDLHPPIFLGSSFLYQVQISRVSALTNLSVTGLPTGLVYDATARTISGISTEDGVKTVVLKATFSDASVLTRNLVLRIIRPPAAPIVKAAFTAVTLASAASTSISLVGKFEDPDTTSAARLNTSLGSVDIILYPLATPATVINFLSYRNNGRYDDGFFHRSVVETVKPFSIVQGGGYRHTAASGFTRVTKAAAIPNEPGISNVSGTVAMAKLTGNPDSATSEFFVNLDNNASNLDAQNGGFTVFGRVSDPSLAVMKSINALPKKNYTVQIGATSGTQLLENVPTTSANSGDLLDPALLVKVPSVTIPPLLKYEVVSANPAVATASLVGTDIKIVGVAGGSTTITVKAIDLDNSDVSQTIAVTVPLTAPTNLVSTTVSNSAVTLTWEGGSGGYLVEYREAGSTGAFLKKKVGNLLTTTLPNLAPGKLYEIRLKSTASDLLGNIIDSSSFTPSIEIRALDAILGDPHPPTFLNAPFFYQVEVSRVDALTNLTVTGLPAGLVYNPGARTVTGTIAEDGLKTAVVTATFTGGAVVSRSLILRTIRPQTAPVVKQAFTAVNVATAVTSTVSVTGKFEDPDTASAARLNTSSGIVDIILYPLATPATVANFLSYINNGGYNDSFFHRSVADSIGSLFIVQGGGYQYAPANGFTRVTKAAAVQNEPGISNRKGTVAMAKVGGSPNSATSEFFINLSDLNASNLDLQNEGFTVFGRVSAPTLAVMEGINALPKKNYTVAVGTGTQSLTDVPIISPTSNVLIEPALLVKMPTVTLPPILKYEVVSQNTSIVTASLSGTDINITGVAAGSTTVQVKATDLDGQLVTQSISVTVQ